MAGFTVTRRGVADTSDGGGQSSSTVRTWLGINVLDPRYGAKGDGVTDDSTAVQNAINAASTAAAGTGFVNVVLSPGYTFLLGSLTPKNNVRLWCFGAKLKLKPAAAQAMFFSNAGTLTNFEIRGGFFPGTGAETTNQAVLQVNNPGACQDVNVYDTTVTNWATGAWYFGNVIRARAINNTILNSGTPTGTNAINFVSQLASGTAQECIATGNVIENCQTYGIAYVNTGTTVNTECRVIIANNYCSGAAASGNGSGGIDLEFAAASIGEGSKFVVSGNVCDFTGSIATSPITIVGSSGTTDGAIINRVTVTGNTVSSTSTGMRLTGSYIACTGNTIDAVVQGISAGKTAAAQDVGITISANVLHMPTTATNHAINADGVADSHIVGNIILFDSGQTSVAPSGISVNNFNRVRVIDNHVSFAAAQGIQFANGSEFEARGNYVRNPQDGQVGPTGQGIKVSSTVTAGLMQRIYSNTVVDDRGGHKMFFGIDCNNTGIAVDVRENRISGWTSAAINAPLTRADNQLTSGASAGRATLAAGTVTVSTAEIQASDNVLLTVVSPAGTRGEVQLGTITAGTSFVINSIQPGTASTVQAADTSIVYWRIDH